MPAQTVIKVRRDTAANWISTDPTLASGEIGFETDTNQLKIGNGSLAWTALDYTSGGASVEISETAPASPDEGNVWFNSTDGRAYIYYDSTWVDLNPGIAGPEGPAGVAIQTSEPASTDVLWLDTDETPDVPVPAGGTDGQVLTKTSSADYATAWENIVAVVPVGGTTGQVLAKSNSTDYATQWVTPSPVGLELIKTQTIGTAVSTVTVTDAFSSAYDNYKIILTDSVASANAGLDFRLGSATANYVWSWGGFNFSGNLINYAGDGDRWRPGESRTDGATRLEIDLSYPFQTRLTYMTHRAIWVGSGQLVAGGYLNDSTSYTSFTIFRGTGTITGGTIRVYGYKKA
jgi:hypothetical protein